MLEKISEFGFLTSKQFIYMQRWYVELHIRREETIKSWFHKPFSIGDFFESDPSDPVRVTLKNPTFIAEVEAYQKKGFLGKFWQRLRSTPSMEIKQKVVWLAKASKQYFEIVDKLPEEECKKLHAEIIDAASAFKKLENFKTENLHFKAKIGFANEIAPWKRKYYNPITFRNRLDSLILGKRKRFEIYINKYYNASSSSEYFRYTEYRGFQEYLYLNIADLYKNHVQQLQALYTNPSSTAEWIQKKEEELQEERFAKVMSFARESIMKYDKGERSIQKIDEILKEMKEVKEIIWDRWEKAINYWKQKHFAFSSTSVNAEAARTILFPSDKPRFSEILKHKDRRFIINDAYASLGKFHKSQTLIEQLDLMKDYIIYVKKLVFSPMASLNEMIEKGVKNSSNESFVHWRNFVNWRKSGDTEDKIKKAGENAKELVNKATKIAILLLHPDKHPGLILPNEMLAPMNGLRQCFQEEVNKIQQDLDNHLIYHSTYVETDYFKKGREEKSISPQEQKWLNKLNLALGETRACYQAKQTKEALAKGGCSKYNTSTSSKMF